MRLTEGREGNEEGLEKPIVTRCAGDGGRFVPRLRSGLGLENRSTSLPRAARVRFALGFEM
jgi:hypothetical protein